ncbi:MAG TPA: DUF5946 family protein [Candidatus Dormibacteraeota bacterium]|nr:DUF5946 family protein [Candidatus Dormibacteraeota bacterium]
MRDIYSCPECGAALVDEKNCWQQLEEILSWEYQFPELLAQHFLTVAIYNIQHPSQFSDEAVQMLRRAFVEKVGRATPTSQIRLEFARRYEGSKKILKPESERKVVFREWKMTIADVYLPQDAKGTASRVRAWAQAPRAEL